MKARHHPLPKSQTAQTALVEAARDTAPVAGLTHNFYRYPARFSPKFVRATIEAFSAPGDLVLDPFMGGGTTLVEALAAGRYSVGTDISSLAGFISEVKTTIYSDREIMKLSRWATRVAASLNMRRQNRASHGIYDEAGYLRHLHDHSTWRLRKAIEQSLTTAVALSEPRLEAFARCVVLRTAQWALDGRKTLPSIDEFRITLTDFAERMIKGTKELRAAVDTGWGSKRPRAHCLIRSSAGLESEPMLRHLPTPRLVITSPPYPGVHVLYHRWQVDGRKESPAPFWIANKLDGSGESYYTMGSRKADGLAPYFEQLRLSLRSIASICGNESTVVQVVAFSNPSWQLSRYLAAADDAGLTEFRLPALKNNADGRLWRTVPNRRWYADQLGKTSGSEEVVLFHRKR